MCPPLPRTPLHGPHVARLAFTRVIWMEHFDTTFEPVPFACQSERIRAVMQDALKDMSSNRVNPWEWGTSGPRPDPPLSLSRTRTC